MGEDGIHDPTRILEELVHAFAVNILSGAVETLGAFPVRIRILGAPIFSRRCKDTGIRNSGEAIVVASSLKHHHVDV